MSIAEVARALKAYQKKITLEQKQKASFDYAHAMLLGKIISHVISGKGKPPRLYDVYPELFKEERQRSSINAFIARANAISKNRRKENK